MVIFLVAVFSCNVLVQASSSVDVHQPKPYEFGYSIKDQHGEHHRHESGNGVGMVIGNYGFTDDRGISRQVNYIADRDGFRAQIKTNEPGTSNQSPAAVQVISDAPYANVAAAPYADQSRVSQPVLPQVSQSVLPQVSQPVLPQVSQLAAPLISKPAIESLVSKPRALPLIPQPKYLPFVSQRTLPLVSQPESLPFVSQPTLPLFSQPEALPSVFKHETLPFASQHTLPLISQPEATPLVSQPEALPFNSQPEALSFVSQPEALPFVFQPGVEPSVFEPVNALLISQPAAPALNDFNPIFGLDTFHANPIQVDSFYKSQGRYQGLRLNADPDFIQADSLPQLNSEYRRLGLNIHDEGYRYDFGSRGHRQGRHENLGYRGYDFGNNEKGNALGYSGHPEHNAAILNNETPLIGGFVRRYDSRLGNLA